MIMNVKTESISMKMEYVHVCEYEFNCESSECTNVSMIVNVRMSFCASSISEN